MTPPPIRRNLAVKDAFRKGVPRFVA